MVRFAIALAALLLLATSCATSSTERGMSLRRDDFGVLPDGRKVGIYTLENAGGLRVRIMDYGACVVSIEAPDRNGSRENVVLSFDTLDEYVKGHPYFGVTVGRCANRIANGRFQLGGREYTLATNNGEHHLHGGKVGFDKVLWQSESRQLGQDQGLEVVFRHRSPDGDEGYPGTLVVEVIYTLTPKDELRVQYEASTDQETVCNLTHHSYFNLAGSGSILDHDLEIAAESYTPVSETLIPTGEIAPVRGTPFDFRDPVRIGARIAQVAGGYDHNYALRIQNASREDGTHFAAKLRDPKSGRSLSIRTTEPGLQFYSGNFLDGVKGSGGRVFEKHHGLCLEAQKFPNAINQASFRSGNGSPILKPGAVYRQTTIHHFLAR